MAYGTDAGFDTWLETMGFELPDDAPDNSILRARGSAYVDGYEAYWTGQRTGGVMQEDAWPRTGTTVNCIQPVPSDAIPPTVVKAAYRAAYLEAVTPGILAGPTATPGKRVRRQKVDVIEREFFDDGKAEVGSGPSFIDSIIDGALRAFICDETKTAAFLWSVGS